MILENMLFFLLNVWNIWVFLLVFFSLNIMWCLLLFLFFLIDGSFNVFRFLVIFVCCCFGDFGGDGVGFCFGLIFGSISFVFCSFWWCFFWCVINDFLWRFSRWEEWCCFILMWESLMLSICCCVMLLYNRICDMLVFGRVFFFFFFKLGMIVGGLCM